MADANKVIDILTNQIAQLTKDLAVHKVALSESEQKVKELESQSPKEETDE